MSDHSLDLWNEDSCFSWLDPRLYKSVTDQRNREFSQRYASQKAQGTLLFGPLRRAKEQLSRLPAEAVPSKTNSTLCSKIRIFSEYSTQGHLLLAVTLVTAIKDDEEGSKFSKTQSFRELWDKYLLQAFRQYLPKTKQHYLLDSTYFLHTSEAIHFHGIVMIPKSHAHRVWVSNSLNERLNSKFRSWRKNKKNIRPTKVTRFLIRRIANTPDEMTAYNTWGPDAVASWLTYAAHEKPRARKHKYKGIAKVKTDH